LSYASKKKGPKLGWSSCKIGLCKFSIVYFVFIEFLISLFSLSTFYLQNKFEQRKSELTSQSHMENASDGEQSIHEYPSDWDIWIDSVGKKRGRIFGLGFMGRMFISTSSQQLHLEEVDALRSQIQALNESLQR